MKTMLLLCALIVGSSSVWAAATTYQHVFSAKPSTGNDVTLSSVKWNISATNLGNYNSGNYAGVQLGTSSKNGSITLTSSSAWGSNTGTYKDKTKITEVRLWLNLGGTSVTPTVTIGGKSATSDGTTVVKNSSAGSDWTKATKVTFTPAADGNTGVVVINVATVKAGYICCMEIDCEEAGSASDPSISLGSNSINATAASTDGTINVTYNNIATVDAEVKFYESDGTTAATYDWLDAEINGDKNLYYVIGANTGDTRTAYMKVHQKNTEVYSNLITVTQSAPAVVTLDFSSNDWGISESPTKTVAATDFTSGGYTITLEGGSGDKEGYYFDSDNIMLGKSGASLTLPAFGFNVNKIKVYGTSGASGSVKFNIYVGNDAVSTEVTSSKVDHEFAIDAEKQGVGTVYVIKVTSTDNMRITKIEIYGNGCEAGLVGAAGWATYVTESPVTYAEGDAFAVTSVGTSVELTSVTSVPTGTPLLLKGAGQKTAILLDAEPSDITNKLAVSDGSNGVNDYVLYNGSNGVGFYKWTGSALASRKVYLPASAVAGARSFIGFDNGATGITNINSEAKPLFNGDFYNIAGQRVAQPTKGLYIVNGKKVVIK